MIAGREKRRQASLPFPTRAFTSRAHTVFSIDRRAEMAVKLEREWAYPPQRSVECPACGGSLKVGVALCKIAARLSDLTPGVVREVVARATRKILRGAIGEWPWRITMLKVTYQINEGIPGRTAFPLVHVQGKRDRASGILCCASDHNSVAAHRSFVRINTRAAAASRSGC